MLKIFENLIYKINIKIIKIKIKIKIYLNVIDAEYKKALKKYVNLFEFINKKFYSLRTSQMLILEIHINFGLNNHKEVLKKIDNAIKAIDENIYTINETKNYYKAFLYNIEMVSSLVERQMNRANSAKVNLIKPANFEVFKTAPVTFAQMDVLEARYPIINDKQENYAIYTIGNEYSQSITASQRKLVFKYIDDVRNILVENKISN